MNQPRQSELLRFLLHQLRGVTKEVCAYQAVFSGLRPELRAECEAMLELQRRAKPVGQRVEREFEGFDELIDEFTHVSADESLGKLLEHYKPVGRPN